MAYQVLARQWRPHRFEDVVGQDYTVRALSYALDHQKLHSAYLFAGSHGVGKTSLARILARAINCQQGVSAKPCDACPACLNMLAGQAVDVIEIDAASRTKVEDTRELLDQVAYAPTMSRYKIYIIDEVHMLSTHSFNALLKTLEEPPPHVLFLLATTHPDKLPVTVRSRCLQFHLRPILSHDIETQLTTILTTEAINAEPPALTAIAKAARGSMRDALSLLDQAINVGQGQIKLNEVTTMLGLADEELLTNLIDALLAQDIHRLITLVRTHTLTITNLPVQLLELLQQAALYQFAPDAINGQNTQVTRLAAALNQETLQLYYQLCLHAVEDVTKAPEPLLAVEMWLLRLLHFNLAPAITATPMPVQNSGHPQRTPLQVESTPSTRETNPVAAQTSKRAQEIPQAVESASPQHGAPAVTTTPEALPPWTELLPALGLTGMARILAEQAQLEWLNPATAQLRLPKSQASLAQPTHLEIIATALSNYAKHPVKLNLVLADQTVASPAAVAQQREQQQRQTLLTELQTDPTIQAIVSTFDATIGVPH